MILGLDVGGTQTDAVLIDAGRIAAAAKIPTSRDLLATLRTALEAVLSDVAPGGLERMAFSTTMTINAIVEDRLDPTGMIVSSGPGMDPAWFSVGPSYHVVEGCLDHQGFEAKPLDRTGVQNAASRIIKEGIRILGVVSKFSVRNPLLELQAAKWAGDAFSHVAMGHRVSGTLNFPRRIATTYLNAALYRIHKNFSDALVQILKEKGLNGPRYLLKPDGGTMDLDKSIQWPARTAQSGPAASVMGALALDGCKGETLVLDVGGTTTDMAVVMDGTPLLKPLGIRLGPYRTLIRSLLTHSMGIGGDSEVRMDPKGNLRIGPIRKGKPVALGGPAPTPTDAMIALDLLTVGHRNAAAAAMERLGAPAGWDAATTAERTLHTMAEAIAASAKAFIYNINSRPVYTIHEVLADRRIKPGSVLIIGGPAPQIAGYIEKALGLPSRFPRHYGVANAVGAAVARVTSEITLQADTQRGSVVIPEADVEQAIDQDFDMEQAIALGRTALCRQAAEIGAHENGLEICITEKQMFAMIRGYARTGRNIRLRMGIMPGLIPGWEIGG
ncbi:MAG: hydantoinase/oxoprolinase family protein [Deltaproteobacteria bacterium]|nr:hydantoinase/oxoprolinase family protein [Deltaproteobacteria bacterium]